MLKPILSNGGNSASIEKQEVVIPVKRPDAAPESKIKKELLLASSKASLESSPLKPKKKIEPVTKPPAPPSLIKPRQPEQTVPSHVVVPMKPKGFSTTQPHIPSGTISSPPPVLKKAVLSPHNANQKPNEEIKAGLAVKKPSESSKLVPAHTEGKSLINECKMTDEEKTIYGDRFPQGYQKISLIGKGGCALVWLGKKIGSDTKIAIKQFAKSGAYKSKSDIESCKAEIEIGKTLFESKGVAKDDYEEYPGVKSVAALLDIIEDAKDVWIVYELGGTSLTKLLFDVKGEFFKGERLYRVIHQPFYKELKNNPIILKQLLRKLLEVLDLLQHHRIIHCDLKPDNLLVAYDGHNLSLKIIDFGSAFMYGQSGALRMATPEYMPPECLELMQSTKESLDGLSARTQPWSVDMWSVGAILLEILTGFPQWLSLKGRVEVAKHSITGNGVFGVQGKSAAKIIQKQKETVGKIREVLKKYESFNKDGRIVELLGRMLDMNPKTRISPKDALNHPSLAYD